MKNKIDLGVICLCVTNASTAQNKTDGTAIW